MFGSLENRFIYRPARYPAGDWRPVGLDFQDVYFDASDGCRLHGWYCSNPVGVGLDWRSDRPVVLYCHGNAGNISHRAAGVRRWQQRLGVDVFLFDYRGYGRSEGRPHESGLYRDSRAAYDFLATQRGVRSERIILRGGSLGGAVAVELALQAPHRGLILESTFTSLVEVARRKYPFLPVQRLLRSRFPSKDRIGRCPAPVLITHGTKDAVVPHEHGVALARSTERATLVSIEGADHHNVMDVGGDAYFRSIADFLEKCFERRPVSAV